MDYHSDFSAITRTMLKDFRTEGRRWYHGRYVTGTIPAKEPSREMEFGTLAHYALLEPDKFDAHYSLIPAELLAKKDGKVDPRGAASTNAAKAFIAAEAAAGRIAIKEAERDRLIEVARAVMDTRLYKRIRSCSAAQFETRIDWYDDTGLRCKCKPDILIPAERLVLVIDLKTCDSAAPNEFPRAAKQHQYWLQACHYSAGVRAHFGQEVVFRFLAVEADAPYRTCEYDYQLRAADWAEYRRTLEQLAECYQTNDWREPWEHEPHTIESDRWTLHSDAVTNDQPISLGAIA